LLSGAALQDSHGPYEGDETDRSHDNLVACNSFGQCFEANLARPIEGTERELAFEKGIPPAEERADGCSKNEEAQGAKGVILRTLVVGFSQYVVGDLGDNVAEGVKAAAGDGKGCVGSSVERGLIRAGYGKGGHGFRRERAVPTEALF